MNRVNLYIKESYAELMTKVSWPTWDELTNSAIVVAVAALIMALLVFGMDKSASVILGIFYSIKSMTMTDEKKWYVMRVISGKERKTKEYIEGEINRSKWGEVISQVLVPMEKIYKIKDGKKDYQGTEFFPGYILMEADETRLTGEMLQTIRNITGVINFLTGNNNKPQALRKPEVNRILGKVDEMLGVGETTAEPFLVGETVKIIDGPFNDFMGLVEEVNEEKKKLKVNVKIFGRKTPVELNYVQVEKQV